MGYRLIQVAAVGVDDGIVLVIAADQPQRVEDGIEVHQQLIPTGEPGCEGTHQLGRWRSCGEVNEVDVAGIRNTVNATIVGWTKVNS